MAVITTLARRPRRRSPAQTITVELLVVVGVVALLLLETVVLVGTSARVRALLLGGVGVRPRLPLAVVEGGDLSRSQQLQLLSRSSGIAPEVVALGQSLAVPSGS